jgi:glc operon protein GlcG
VIIRKPTLSSDAALQLVRSATGHAKANGWTVAVAVVDAAGDVLASLRMDDAVAPIAGYALDKAYTAVMFKTASADLVAEMEASTGQRMGFESRGRYLVWQGGLPIRHEGAVVGGIGVSGAKGPDDIACARFALTEAGFDPDH